MSCVVGILNYVHTHTLYPSEFNNIVSRSSRLLRYFTDLIVCMTILSHIHYQCGAAAFDFSFVSFCHSLHFSLVALCMDDRGFFLLFLLLICVYAAVVNAISILAS